MSQSLFFTTRWLQWAKTDQVSQSLSQSRWDHTYSQGFDSCLHDLIFKGLSGVPTPCPVSWSCLASTSNSTCLELNSPSSSPRQFFLLTSLFHQRYLHFPVTRPKISETPNCFLFLSPSTSPSSSYSSSFWMNASHVCHFLSLLTAMYWVQIPMSSLDHCASSLCILSIHFFP